MYKLILVIFNCIQTLNKIDQLKKRDKFKIHLLVLYHIKQIFKRSSNMNRNLCSLPYVKI